MQIKSGIDIIEVERIKSSIDEMGDNFLNRVYTENEIQYCESKKKNIATRGAPSRRTRRSRT